MSDQRVNISPKKQKKCTRTNGEKLEDARRMIGYDKRSFAAVLGLPYRTYQDYAYGKRSTPQQVVTAAMAAMKRDKELTKRIADELRRDIARLYPSGIISEIKE